METQKKKKKKRVEVWQLALDRIDWGTFCWCIMLHREYRGLMMMIHICVGKGSHSMIPDICKVIHMRGLSFHDIREKRSLYDIRCTEKRILSFPLFLKSPGIYSFLFFSKRPLFKNSPLLDFYPPNILFSNSDIISISGQHVLLPWTKCSVIVADKRSDSGLTQGLSGSYSYDHWICTRLKLCRNQILK